MVGRDRWARRNVVAPLTGAFGERDRKEEWAALGGGIVIILGLPLLLGLLPFWLEGVVLFSIVGGYLAAVGVWLVRRLKKK
jgi:hypothetical protein